MGCSTPVQCAHRPPVPLGTGPKEADREQREQHGVQDHPRPQVIRGAVHHATPSTAHPAVRPTGGEGVPGCPLQDRGGGGEDPADMANQPPSTCAKTSCARPWTSGSPAPWPDRLTATITALTHASAAANAAETHTPEQAQARLAIKDCERRLARYQAAIEAGADPTVVTQWINHAQRDKEAARKKLDALRHHHQLRKRNKDRDRKVEALITVSSVVVTLCPRGDLNPHAR